jgi:hypothetical protein
MATELLEELIDDVMTSATMQPSVPAVVFEVVTEFVTSSGGGEGAKEEETGETITYSENDISDIIDSELEKEEEKKKVEEKQPSPPPAPQQKKEEVEVQEVKVEVKREEEEEEGKPKVITFGGQPVPDSGVVVINGYAKSVEEPAAEENKPRQKEKSPAPKPPTPSDAAVKRQSSAIPQTDLDTFETRMTIQNGSRENLDESNPDDESDKKSDTGSAATVDSLDKELPAEGSEVSTVVVTRRKKGNIRPRNVSSYSISSFSVSIPVLPCNLFFSCLFFLERDLLGKLVLLSLC